MRENCYSSKVVSFSAQFLLMPQGLLKIKKHEWIKMKLSYCCSDNLEFDFYQILFPFRGMGRVNKSPIF